MSELIEHYVDLSTGEVEARELDADFIAARDALNAENELLAQQAEAEKAIKDAAKADLLARLGITAEEAALLLA